MQIHASLSIAYTPTSISAGPVSTLDGTLEFAVGGLDCKIYIYKLECDTIHFIHSVEKHQASIACVSYSPDREKLASGDTNRVASVFKVSDAYSVMLSNMVFHNARINGVAWSPDSVRLATCSVDQSIIIWDITKSARKRVSIPNAHRQGAEKLVWIDEQKIVSTGCDGFIKVWEVPET